MIIGASNKHTRLATNLKCFMSSKILKNLDFREKSSQNKPFLIAVDRYKQPKYSVFLSRFHSDLYSAYSTDFACFHLLSTIYFKCSASDLPAC